MPDYHPSRRKDSFINTHEWRTTLDTTESTSWDKEGAAHLAGSRFIRGPNLAPHVMRKSASRAQGWLSQHHCALPGTIQCNMLGGPNAAVVFQFCCTQVSTPGLWAVWRIQKGYAPIMNAKTTNVTNSHDSVKIRL
jgi:hypothetical protein